MTSPAGPECCPSPTLLDDSTASRHAPVLAALGDPTRLKLAAFLTACSPSPVCACAFPEDFGISRSTLSHHLSKLVDAGVAERSKRGKWSYYTISENLDPAVLTLLRGLASGEPISASSRAGDDPTIVFLSANSAESALFAADTARSLLGDRATVVPNSDVSVDGAQPDPGTIKSADRVIILGPNSDCPRFPSVDYSTWELDIDAMEPDQLRAEITDRVTKLAAWITSTPD